MSGKVQLAFEHKKPDWPRPDCKKWPFNRIIALDDGRVRLESDSVAWLVKADQRLTPTQPGKTTKPALQEKVGQGPSEAKRLSFSKVRAEVPNGELKVELCGGAVTLIDLKSDNVETSSSKMASKGKYLRRPGPLVIGQPSLRALA